jgi:tellurite resistance protein TehA-like permease
MSGAREGIRTLFPGYFALVMATGIVSIACMLLGMTAPAWILLVANAVFYAVLWVLYVIRVAAHARNVKADFMDHVRGPGFFTLVAGTCVLGSQLVIIAGRPVPALILWFLGWLLWLFFIFGFFTAVTVRETKPGIETGIHGGWLLAVVGTQTLAVLGALLAPSFQSWAETFLLLSLALYLLGGLLYIMIITLLLYRLAFFPLAPAALSPTYWISMGAAAVTTLAGARLMLDYGQWGFLPEILPFLKGFTLMYWAIATWWIPFLVVLGIWRHVARRHPVRYEPAYWSLVFPLGMYTASTFVLSKAEGLAAFAGISRGFIWVALAAWAVVFVGMAVRLLGTLFGRPRIRQGH